MFSRNLERWVVQLSKSGVVWSLVGLLAIACSVYPSFIQEQMRSKIRVEQRVNHLVDAATDAQAKLNAIRFSAMYGETDHFDQRVSDGLEGFGRAIRQLVSEGRTLSISQSFVEAVEKRAEDRRQSFTEMARTFKALRHLTIDQSPSVVRADREATNMLDLQMRSLKNAVSLSLDVERAERVLFFVTVVTRTTLILLFGLLLMFYRYQKHLLEKVRSVQTALRDSLRDSQAASQHRERFVRIVTHEVRTPMNKTRGYLELLEKSELSVWQRTTLRKAITGSRSITAILASSFNSSWRYDSATGYRKAFSVDQLIEDLNSSYEFYDESARCQLVTSVKAQPKNLVVGDYDLLLTNLGSRVLHFARHRCASRVLLTLDLAPYGDKIANLKFELTGEFDRDYCELYTVDEKSFLDELITNTSGLISTNEDRSFSSESFMIALPVSTMVAASPNSGASRASVLVVDDEKLNRALCQETLTVAGFDVSTCSGAEEAFELLRKQIFDVIVMDLLMPGIDGVTAIRMIREGHAGSENISVPIVVLTASVSERDRERSKEAGATAYLEKPFDPEILASVIEAEARGNTRLDSTAIDRLKRISKLGKKNLLKDIVELALSETPAALDAFQLAVINSEAEMVGSIAHRLKSTFANVGALKLSEVFAAVERNPKVDLADAPVLLDQIEREWPRAARLLREVATKPADEPIMPPR